MKRLLWLAVLAGCASGPVDAQGNYTVAVTNRDNGCNFQNWVVGKQSTGISVVITQQNANATADVQGLAVIGLDALLGGHTFTGKVNGNELDLSLQGTNATTTGNCTYTYNGMIAATLSGDTLTGRISYSAATNGNSDCASIQGCVTFQDFNGTRPPQ
jgi:hypothetical protein